MKINRDTGRAPGEERQVYRRGAQPAAPETPAETPQAPAAPKPPAEAPQAPAGADIPAPPRRKAYDVDQDKAFMDARPQPEPQEEEDETPVRRRRFPIGLVIVLVMLALVAYGGWQLLKLYQEVDGAGENGEIQTITIEQGSSVADIAAQLESSGIVQHGWLFRYYTQYSGRAEGLQYGDFELYPGMGYNDIITALSEQKVL